MADMPQPDYFQNDTVSGRPLCKITCRLSICSTWLVGEINRTLSSLFITLVVERGKQLTKCLNFAVLCLYLGI